MCACAFMHVCVTDLLGVCVEGDSQVQQQLPLLHPLDEGLQTHDNDDNENVFVYKPVQLPILLSTLLILWFRKKKENVFSSGNPHTWRILQIFSGHMGRNFWDCLVVLALCSVLIRSLLIPLPLRMNKKKTLLLPPAD